VNFNSWCFVYATHLLCTIINYWQLNCTERLQIIKLILFTNLNVNISSSCCWNSASKSETKNRNRTDDSDNFCEMFIFIFFYSLSYSKKTIFVCLSVRKKWMILIIYDEKSALWRMCINFLCNTLLKTSVRFRLSIKIIHFKFVFQSVITYKISSFSAVKVNHCLYIFI